MKSVAFALAALVALPLTVGAEVSREDIKKLVAAKISDDVILSFIRRNGPALPLSADDLVDLKQAGASERVLAAMMTPAAPAAAPRTEIADRTVYAIGNGYAYDFCTPYYYPYSYSYYSPYYYPRSYYTPYYSVYYGPRYTSLGLYPAKRR